MTRARQVLSTVPKGLSLTVVPLLLAAAIGVALVACSRSPRPPEVFSDEVSGFTVVTPPGWFMQSGEVLRARADEEARRLKDSQLALRPEGGPIAPLTRITRYEPGKAPGPNPTIVFVRFDLRRFPPGTSPDDLLRMGVATARSEGEPVTVTMGGRPWRKLVATRVLNDPAGQPTSIRQEVYVTASEPWGIGVTISAVPPQFTEYRAALDAVLQSANLNQRG